MLPKRASMTKELVTVRRDAQTSGTNGTSALTSASNAGERNYQAKALLNQSWFSLQGGRRWWTPTREICVCGVYLCACVCGVRVCARVCVCVRASMRIRMLMCACVQLCWEVSCCRLKCTQSCVIAHVQVLIYAELKMASLSLFIVVQGLSVLLERNQQ